jgi:hypothetical protein
MGTNAKSAGENPKAKLIMSLAVKTSCKHGLWAVRIVVHTITEGLHKKFDRRFKKIHAGSQKDARPFTIGRRLFVRLELRGSKDDSIPTRNPGFISHDRNENMRKKIAALMK